MSGYGHRSVLDTGLVLQLIESAEYLVASSVTVSQDERDLGRPYCKQCFRAGVAGFGVDHAGSCVVGNVQLAAFELRTALSLANCPEAEAQAIVERANNLRLRSAEVGPAPATGIFVSAGILNGVPVKVRAESNFFRSSPVRTIEYDTAFVDGAPEQLPRTATHEEAASQRAEGFREASK